MILSRSLPFRLSLTYASIIFFASAILLFLFYFTSISLPVRSLQDDLRQERDRLVQAYRAGGLEKLEAELSARGSDSDHRKPFHALIDANGREITSNLPSRPGPGDEGWVSVEADQHLAGQDIDREALLLDHRLADGSRLLIGRDVEDLNILARNVKFTATVMALVTLGLTIFGAFMGRNVGRRIERLEKSASQITGNNLSHRMPLSGEDDELDQLADTLNLMLANIELAVDGLRRTSDCVAHELRMPLSRLRSDIEAMLHQKGTPSRQSIENALDEIDSLAKRFDAVFAIARLATEHESLEIQPVEITPILSDALELYHGAAEERQIRVSADLQQGLMVQGNADLLFQAICNLLDNAIKFSPVGGTIHLSARPDGPAVAIELKDSGPGIPEELHHLVTQRFYRAPSAAGVPGIGIGLAFVEAVNCIHDAKMHFQSEPDGLKVVWTIPGAQVTED